MIDLWKYYSLPFVIGIVYLIFLLIEKPFIRKILYANDNKIKLFGFNLHEIEIVNFEVIFMTTIVFLLNYIHMYFIGQDF